MTFETAAVLIVAAIALVVLVDDFRRFRVEELPGVGVEDVAAEDMDTCHYKNSCCARALTRNVRRSSPVGAGELHGRPAHRQRSATRPAVGGPFHTLNRRADG